VAVHKILAVGDVATAILAQVCKLIVQLCMFVIFGILFAGILFREFLDLPLSFTEEISLYAMVWLTMACMPLALLYNEHVAMTFVIDSVPKGVRIVFSLAAYVSIIVSCCFLLAYSPRFVMGGFNQVLPTFPLLTQGGMYIAIPLSLTATVLVCLVKIMRIISGESVRKSAVVDVPSA
jgi:TRAP-type C4-dicarboxylate transport system permease small subunit